MSQTESVKIVISAEDNASVVLAQAQAKMREHDKAVKQVGRSYQDSGDSIDKFARMFGGGWLSNAGYQIKEVADAGIKAREVLLSGGTAATAMKAGLIGLTGVISFQFGKAMGDAIFQTERWTQVMADAREESKRLDRQLQETAREQQQDIDQEISETEDPVKRAKKRADEILRIAKDKARQEEILELKRFEFETRRDARANAKSDMLGGGFKAASAVSAWWGGEEPVKQAEEAYRAIEEVHKASKDRLIKLERQQVEDAAKLKKDADKKMADESEKTKQAAMKKEWDALVKFLQFEVAIQKKFDDQENARLKERTRATFERGQKAGRIAGERGKSLMDELAEAQGRSVDTSQSRLQATESRFLSRSSSTQDFQRQAAEAAKRSADIQAKSKAVLDNMATNLKKMADTLGITQVVEF